jgi:hypothetical protein
MGYSSKVKAATYVQPDLKDGDWSVDELAARNADQQETANTANRGTWPKQNTLTASEIATLDGKGGKSTERNAIGAPVALMSKQPRGYKSSTSTPDVEGESKPVKG